MARPQTYDKQDVLERSMQQFWRHGYAGTTVKHLVESTSLQPGSLYGAFRSKRQLFLNALDLYFERLYGQSKDALNIEGTAEKRIRNFIENIVIGYIQESNQESCFLVNTLLETKQEDKEIRLKVHAMIRKLEEEICSVLKDARAERSLELGASPETLAKILISNIFGLQVYSRMNTDVKEIKQMINNLMCIFKVN